MIAIEYTQSAVPPSIVMFEREDAEKNKLNERLMERKDAARRGELEPNLKGLIKTKNPFTWERLGYTVPVTDGQKHQPVTKGNPVRRCEADPNVNKPADPSNCTVGACTPSYWFQYEQNNVHIFSTG
jgi:Lytic polysaccharide monooxygenase AA14